MGEGLGGSGWSEGGPALEGGYTLPVIALGSVAHTGAGIVKGAGDSPGHLARRRSQLPQVEMSDRVKVE